MLEMKAEEDLEQGPLDAVENQDDFGYTGEELLAMERRRSLYPGLQKTKQIAGKNG